MDHARAGEVGLGEEAGHAGQVHAGGRVHVGVPGDARVGGPGHVALALVTWVAAPGHAGGADVLLVVSVPRQFLEQEVVQALLSHVALDSDDVGLHRLDQLEDVVGCEEAFLQGRVNL